MATKQEPRRETRREAATAGRKFYLAAKQCKRCRTIIRYTTSGGCVKCTKRRSLKATADIRQDLADQ